MQGVWDARHSYKGLQLATLPSVPRACAVPFAVQQMTNQPPSRWVFEAAHERAKQPTVREEGQSVRMGINRLVCVFRVARASVYSSPGCLRFEMSTERRFRARRNRAQRSACSMVTRACMRHAFSCPPQTPLRRGRHIDTDRRGYCCRGAAFVHGGCRAQHAYVQLPTDRGSTHPRGAFVLAGRNLLRTTHGGSYQRRDAGAGTCAVTPRAHAPYDCGSTRSSLTSVFVAGIARTEGCTEAS